MRQTGLLVVSLRSVNFGCLISLRVFRAKFQYFKPSKSTSGLTRKIPLKDYNFSIFGIF